MRSGLSGDFWFGLYKAALDILCGIADPELSPGDKAQLILEILYQKPIPRFMREEAIKQAYWYLDGGNDYKGRQKNPAVVDWEKDFPLIVAPINRVIGHDIRSDKDLHWWTFLSAYMEIGGDCLFSQVVGIRDKQARGEKLENYERKWAKRNADLIELPTRYTQQDDDMLAKFGIKRTK